MAALRIVFMGTAKLSCDSLRGLLELPDFQVAAVVTQPDRPKGRDLKLQPSPVKELGLQAKLDVLQPERVRGEAFLKELCRLRPELIVVVAYGQILPPDILNLPRFGCLNVHTSLLPRYRGAAPIQWAILNGDAETGVTIMKMDAGLDTGGILTQARTPIRQEDTAETLHDRLARIGAELLARTVPDYVAGRIAPQDQPVEGVSYAPKIKKQDGCIDWNQPALTIWNRVRGLVPWPGAFSFLPSRSQPLMLKIWRAEIVDCSGPPGELLRADKSGIVVGCGDMALRILMLQREGGRRLEAQPFLAGHPLQAGQKLG